MPAGAGRPAAAPPVTDPQQIAKDNGYEQQYTQYTDAQGVTAAAKAADERGSTPATRTALAKAQADEQQMLNHLNWAKLNTPFGDNNAIKGLDNVIGN